MVLSGFSASLPVNTSLRDRDTGQRPSRWSTSSGRVVECFNCDHCCNGINTPFIHPDMKHLRYDNLYYSAEQFSSLSEMLCVLCRPLLCNIYKALHNVTTPQHFIRPHRIIQFHFSMYFFSSAEQ